jgi:hypothetical protein
MASTFSTSADDLADAISDVERRQAQMMTSATG